MEAVSTMTTPAPARAAAHQQSNTGGTNFASAPVKANTAPQNLIQRDEAEDREFLTHDPPSFLINPFESDAEQARERAEYEQLRDAYDARLRDVVLRPIENAGHADAITFLNRLRGLSLRQALQLVEDDTFFGRIRHIFRGKSLWTVFVILFFNNRLREPYLRLNMAIMQGDARLTADMISIVLLQRDRDRFYTFLREVCVSVFTGNTLLPEILRLIDNRGQANISMHGTEQHTSVHYEQNAAGNWQLQSFGGFSSSNAYFSGNEVRVLVRMRFVNGDDTANCATADDATCSPFLFPGRYSSKWNGWQSAISRYWNNKFNISNGRQTFRIAFVPIFLTERDPEAINIRVMTNDALQCNGSLAAGRSNRTCWFINTLPDSDISHEFGHVVGASDEYNLPGSFQEVANAGINLTQDELNQTTVEGITGTAANPQPGGHSIPNSIMNNNTDNAQPRHLLRLVRLINGGIATGMPPFTVRRN